MISTTESTIKPKTGTDILTSLKQIDQLTGTTTSTENQMMVTSTSGNWTQESKMAPMTGMMEVTMVSSTHGIWKKNSKTEAKSCTGQQVTTLR